MAGDAKNDGRRQKARGRASAKSKRGKAVAADPGFRSLRPPIERKKDRQSETALQLWFSEQPAVINVPRQSAVRNAAQVIHSPRVRAVIETGTTGITTEGETTRRWRTVPGCFFLGDGAANERAAGGANGRADGCAAHGPGGRPADDRAGGGAKAGALS